MAVPMQFLSDNAASVHPRVWAAMQAADAADSPYDTDRLSAELDDRFAALFQREVPVATHRTATSRWNSAAKRSSSSALSRSVS